MKTWRHVNHPACHGHYSSWVPAFTQITLLLSTLNATEQEVLVDGMPMWSPQIAWKPISLDSCAATSSVKCCDWPPYFPLGSSCIGIGGTGWLCGYPGATGTLPLCCFGTAPWPWIGRSNHHELPYSTCADYNSMAPTFWYQKNTKRFVDHVDLQQFSSQWQASMLSCWVAPEQVKPMRNRRTLPRWSIMRCQSLLL